MEARTGYSPQKGDPAALQSALNAASRCDTINAHSRQPKPAPVLGEFPVVKTAPPRPTPVDTPVLVKVRGTWATHERAMYSGEATASCRISSPTFTATMSSSNSSPMRMLTSNPAATMLVVASSMVRVEYDIGVRFGRNARVAARRARPKRSAKLGGGLCRPGGHGGCAHRPPPPAFPPSRA